MLQSKLFFMTNIEIMQLKYRNNKLIDTPTTIVN